jgi:hypothetical protein
MYLFYRHTAGVFPRHRNKIPSALALRPSKVLTSYAKFTLLRRVFEANSLLGSNCVAWAVRCGIYRRFRGTSCFHLRVEIQTGLMFMDAWCIIM